MPNEQNILRRWMVSQVRAVLRATRAEVRTQLRGLQPRQAGQRRTTVERRRFYRTTPDRRQGPRDRRHTTGTA